MIVTRSMQTNCCHCGAFTQGWEYPNGSGLYYCKDCYFKITGERPGMRD